MRRLPVRLAEEALRDLADIRRYYRENASPAVSARIVARIRKTLSHIARMPKSGVLRPEFGPGARFHVSGAYVIYIEVGAARVDVLRILHASRNRDEIMGAEEN